MQPTWREIWSHGMHDGIEWQTGVDHEYDDHADLCDIPIDFMISMWVHACGEEWSISYCVRKQRRRGWLKRK